MSHTRPPSQPSRNPVRRPSLSVLLALVLLGLSPWWVPHDPSGGSRSLPERPPSQETRPQGLFWNRPGPLDGVLPAGTTAFDERHPGIAKINPHLLLALRQAALDAQNDGVTFFVNSGWRSPKYQERLLDEAITRYGSREAAARWVAPAGTSSHVSGDAVDIGPTAATDWLSRYGAGYGLCQIYANEPWHFELRPDAVRHGCPQMSPDPTHSPGNK